MNNANVVTSSYECLHRPVVLSNYLYGSVTLRGPLKGTTIIVTPVHLTVCPSVPFPSAPGVEHPSS